MKYKILNKVPVFKHKFLKIEEVELDVDAYRTPQHPLRIKRMALLRRDVVGVLVYMPARNVLLLVEQFRYATIATGSGWLLEIVAGVIDEGQTPTEAAEREVLEEVGYKLKSLTRIGGFYTSPGFSDQYTHLFMAETAPELRVAGAGGGLAAETEDIKVHELSVAQVYAMLKQGTLQDAMTLAVLQHFFLFNPAAKLPQQN